MRGRHWSKENCAMRKVALSKSAHALWFETCKALMPARRVLPKQEAAARARIIKGEHRCVYCGDDAGTRDHFRPIIAPGGMPSGYCDDDWNIVPACQTCNSSKGNRHWLVFMQAKTPKSPAGRGVPRLAGRIATLRAFETAGNGKVQTWAARRHMLKLRTLKRDILGMTSMHAARLEQMVAGRSAVATPTAPPAKRKRYIVTKRTTKQ